MTKLVLTGFHKSLYDDKSACAYVAYGTKESPEDNLGVKMGDFYQDPIPFLKHLQKTIKPIFDEYLSSTLYMIQRLDFTNQAPHPHFVISRTDRAVLTDAEVTNIEKCIKRVIISANKEAKQQSTATSNPKLFTPPKSKPERDTTVSQGQQRKHSPSE